MKKSDNNEGKEGETGSIGSMETANMMPDVNVTNNNVRQRIRDQIWRWIKPPKLEINIIIKVSWVK